MHGQEARKSRGLYFAPVGVACAVAFLSAAPAAFSQGCQTAPGKSGIDQYCEVVPDAGGGKGDSDGKDNETGGAGPQRPGGGSPTGPQGLSPELRAAGADGQALSALAKEARGKRRARDGGPSRDGVLRPDPGILSTDSPTPDSSPLGALSAAVSGPGSGSALRWLLILSTLGLLGAAFWRRRQTS